jgi:hypothetical protein
VFSYKPTAFIIASASGEKAFESLGLIMETLIQMPIEGNLKLLVKGAQSKVNNEGNFMDEQLKQQVINLVNALLKWIAARKINQG